MGSIDLDLSDETMAELQAIAAKTGQSVEAVAVELIGKEFAARQTRETRAGIPVQLAIDAASLTIWLADGRELSVPLQQFPKLAAATQAQRQNWQWIGGGVGIHWPDLD